MHFSITTISTLLSVSAFATATPVPAPQESTTAPPSTSPPLTITFAPYLTTTCQQSYIPGVKNDPPSTNITEEVCVTMPYSFGSFFALAQPADIDTMTNSCQVTMFTGQGCTGDKFDNTLVQDCNFMTGGYAESVVLNCAM